MQRIEEQDNERVSARDTQTPCRSNKIKSVAQHRTCVGPTKSSNLAQAGDLTEFRDIAVKRQMAS